MRRHLVTMTTAACLSMTGVVSAQAVGAQAVGDTPGGGAPRVGATAGTAPAMVVPAGRAIGATARDAAVTPVRTAQHEAAVRRLRIRTTYLTGAERTRSYKTTLVATGGRAPYRWRLTSGSLPRGLALSRRGVISGVPTHSEAREFTVQVRDARGRTVRRTLNLAVAPRGGFRLTTTAIGPVTLPAQPDAAVTTLSGYLGRPTYLDQGFGCELNGPNWRARDVAWGALWVRGEAATHEEVRFDRWILSAGRVPVKFATPYDVRIGTTLAQLRHRVPGVTVIIDELSQPGNYLARKDTLSWWLDKKTKRVTSIHHNTQFCD